MAAVKPTGPAPPLAVAPFDATKAKEHQAAWAEHLGVPVEMTNSIGMKFVLIPPGEFDMGSTEAEVAKLEVEARAMHVHEWHIQFLPSELPKHRVRITKPFYLARCEVTQAEYERVVQRNPSRFQGDPNRPVEMVTWDEASAFCRTLGQRPEEQALQLLYRLATGAEWEYACRAGTTTTWDGTDDEGPLKEQAWFVANAGDTTHPVGQKAPNAWGLYDMHGNVLEWCQDLFTGSYYSQSPLEDPPGPADSPGRVLRGGSYGYWSGLCRSAFNYGIVPASRNPDLGFRVAMTIRVAD
jgi:formylglycine-generating enzyme required for sulfatase activity